MDQLQHITNPFLRDWSIIISLLGIASFIVVRWVVSTVAQFRDKSLSNKHSESSKIELFLQNELTLSRAEKSELTKEIKQIQADSSDLENEVLKLRVRLSQVLRYIRYLEKILHENHIDFLPAIEYFDD